MRSQRHQRTRRRHRLRRTLARCVSLALPALLLGACSAITGNGDDPLEGPDRVVHLRLTPPTDSGYDTQTLVDIDLLQSPRQLLTLRPSRHLQGFVLNPNNLFNGMMADLTFQSRATIPGLAPRRHTTSTAEDEVAGFPFDIEVPGGLYDVKLRPGDSTLPAVWVTDLLIDRDSENLELLYPNTQSLNVVRGHVYVGDISQNGMLVQGFDESGSPVSTRALTADSPTTKTRGWYEILFPPGPGTYILRAWEPRDVDPESRLWLPTVEFAGVSFVADETTGEVPEDDRLIRDHDLNIPVGEFTNQGIVVQGSVYATTAPDEPLAGVTVTMSAIVGTPNDTVLSSVFSAETVTDETGGYTLEVMPGHTYDILAEPPAESPYRILRLQAEIATLDSRGPHTLGEGPTIDLALEAKILLRATVADRDSGIHLPGATVEATRVADEIPEPTINGPRYTRSAVVDADGLCQIKLDPGKYDLVYICECPDPEGERCCRPPSGDLARLTEREFSIGPPGPHEIERLLPAGVPIWGRVFDANDAGLGPTYIEVFDQPLPGKTSRMIGEIYTDVDGTFEILLPP